MFTPEEKRQLKALLDPLPLEDLIAVRRQWALIQPKIDQSKTHGGEFNGTQKQTSTADY